MVSGFGAGDFYGVAFCEVAEPGALAFGDLAGAGLDQVAGGVEILCRSEIPIGFKGVDDLLVAEGLAGGVAEAMRIRAEAEDFVDESLLEHLVDALVDAVVQPVTRWGEPVDVRGALVGGQYRLLLLAGNRLAGEFDDFEGTDETAVIVGVQTVRSHRIETS